MGSRSTGHVELLAGAAAAAVTFAQVEVQPIEPFVHELVLGVVEAHDDVVAGCAVSFDVPVAGLGGGLRLGMAEGHIGLRNVRHRRLLLYSDRHRFEIEAHPDTYTVRLTLELAEMAAPVPQRTGRAGTPIPALAHSESLAFPSYS